MSRSRYSFIPFSGSLDMSQTTSSTFKFVLILSFFAVLLILFFKGSDTPSLECPVPVFTISDKLCLSAEVQTALKTSEIIYTANIHKRHVVVKNSPKIVKPWTTNTYPYDYFPATFGCPFTTRRVGALGDGGKWVCGLERYQNSPCILYSFGISTETSFELEMLRTTNCEIFAFDASVRNVTGIPPEFQDRIHFSKTYGGDADGPGVTTLGSAMAKYGHTHIDILKMDVEYSEYKMFEQIISQFGNNLPFSQLLIEIHAFITDGRSFSKLYYFFESLEQAGLRPFRNELNISPIVRKDPKMNEALSEYSFLNINRICLP